MCSLYYGSSNSVFVMKDHAGELPGGPNTDSDPASLGWDLRVRISEKAARELLLVQGLSDFVFITAYEIDTLSQMRLLRGTPEVTWL